MIEMLAIFIGLVIAGPFFAGPFFAFPFYVYFRLKDLKAQEADKIIQRLRGVS